MNPFDSRWSARVTRECNQTCIQVLYASSLVAQADLIHVKVTRDAEDVLESLYAADIFCVQDELEEWLKCNPGEYVWLDGFKRLKDDPDTKGLLTPYLATVLTRNTLGASQDAIGLAFPCPYGTGDTESSEGRQKLVAYYQRVLKALPVPGTPFVTFPLS